MKTCFIAAWANPGITRSPVGFQKKTYFYMSPLKWGKTLTKGEKTTPVRESIFNGEPVLNDTSFQGGRNFYSDLNPELLDPD